MKKNQLLALVFFGFSLLCIPLIVKGAYPYISINYNQSSTVNRKVELGLEGGTGVQEMAISNDISFSNSGWESYQTKKTWYLDYGSGTKTVYVKFKNNLGVISIVYKDTISLSPPVSMGVDFIINSSAPETDSRSVNLKLTWSGGVEEMRISNSTDFGGTTWSTISSDILWQLSAGTGSKIVYVDFKDSAGLVKRISKKIKYTQPANYLSEGTLVKGRSSTIYYFGFDGKLHPFFNTAVYNSWYQDFGGVSQVSDAKIKQYTVGKPMCLKHGTWLVQFKGASAVYMVEPGCVLRRLRSEVEARILYGKNWTKRIVKFDPMFSGMFIYANNDVLENDTDRDGVNTTTEALYGSSDQKTDSDDDGLSDYEEINYWFTDPIIADTDADGHSDGSEIISGYSPVGSGEITSLPSGSYEYPIGSLIKKKNGEYYYRVVNGKFYKVGTQAFTTNKLQSRFAISESDFGFKISSSGNLGNTQEQVFRPQIKGSTDILVNL